FKLVQCSLLANRRNSSSLKRTLSLESSFSTIPLPACRLLSISCALNQARIFERVRLEPVYPKCGDIQSRLGFGTFPVKISITSRFCNTYVSGTIAPLTFAPRQRLPSPV